MQTYLKTYIGGARSAPPSSVVGGARLSPPSSVAVGGAGRRPDHCGCRLHVWLQSLFSSNPHILDGMCSQQDIKWDRSTTCYFPIIHPH